LFQFDSRAALRLVPAPGSEDDAALAARLRAGDRVALALVYERYAPSIFHMLVRLLSRTAEAEDVLQETFVAAFEHALTLRDPGALRAWLFTIARRQAFESIRRRHRWRFFRTKDDEGDIDATLASMAAPGASPEARAELALLDVQLHALPPEQRVAWILRYVEGETLEAIAETSDVSLATVKRWIAAADHAVRRHVDLEPLDG